MCRCLHLFHQMTPESPTTLVLVRIHTINTVYRSLPATTGKHTAAYGLIFWASCVRGLVCGPVCGWWLAGISHTHVCMH